MISFQRLSALLIAVPTALAAQPPAGPDQSASPPPAVVRNPGGSVTIDFDSLADGAVVTNQFPEATFSSTAGIRNLVTAQNLGSSPPNFICTKPTGGFVDCAQDTYIDFTLPVGLLDFLGVGVNDVGQVAEVNVFVGGALDSTVPITGAGDLSVPVLVDLTSFTNVTRIEIVNITDANGIGWDDFSFTPQEKVPTLPAFWIGIAALLLAATGVVALRRRRASTLPQIRSDT